MSDNININGVQGDVIGGKIEGVGNIVGKRIIVSGTINVNALQSGQLPNDLGESLKVFVVTINQLLQKYNISPEQAAPLQARVEELATEVKDIKGGETVSYAKKTTIKAKLASLAEGLLKVLPKAAQIAVAFTPLAPFGKLIGEGVEEIVKAVQEG